MIATGSGIGVEEHSERVIRAESCRWDALRGCTIVSVELLPQTNEGQLRHARVVCADQAGVIRVVDCLLSFARGACRIVDAIDEDALFGRGFGQPDPVDWAVVGPERILECCRRGVEGSGGMFTVIRVCAVSGDALDSVVRVQCSDRVERVLWYCSEHVDGDPSPTSEHVAVVSVLEAD